MQAEAAAEAGELMAAQEVLAAEAPAVKLHIQRVMQGQSTAAEALVVQMIQHRVQGQAAQEL
jgi:hypothetical protein